MSALTSRARRCCTTCTPRRSPRARPSSSPLSDPCEPGATEQCTNRSWPGPCTACWWIRTASSGSYPWKVRGATAGSTSETLTNTAQPCPSREVEPAAGEGTGSREILPLTWTRRSPTTAASASGTGASRSPSRHSRPAWSFPRRKPCSSRAGRFACCRGRGATSRADHFSPTPRNEGRRSRCVCWPRRRVRVTTGSSTGWRSKGPWKGSGGPSRLGSASSWFETQSWRSISRR